MKTEVPGHIKHKNGFNTSVMEGRVAENGAMTI